MGERSACNLGNILDELCRTIVLGLAFLIPLAFFPETYYIFQIKTTLLQLGGWVLSILMILRWLLPGRALLCLGLHPWLILLLGWGSWMGFKSWDSISPVLSQREATRLIWLPVIAFAIFVFFRSERHLGRLLKTIVLSALCVTFFAFVIRFGSVHDYLFSKSGFELDLFDVPLLPWLIKPFFFPPELEHLYLAKEALKGSTGEGIVPISLASFYPGKHDAGTFGNKNFLAAYFLLTLPLLVWFLTRGVLALKRKLTVSAVSALFILGLALLIQLYLLLVIGSRASWVGLFGAFILAGVFLVCYQGSFGKVVRWSLLPLLLMVILSIAQPGRVSSIFNPYQSSNELRWLTWSSWMEGFYQDDSWEGFSSRGWRWATGWGTHSFSVAYPRYQSDRIFKLENNQHSSVTLHAHNQPLGTLGEMGIIGLLFELLLYLTPLWLVLGMMKRKSPGNLLPGLIALALFSQMIQSCFCVAQRYTGVAFQSWLTLGLLMTVLYAKIPPKPTGATYPLKWLPWAIPVVGLWVMPSPGLPLDWLQSQHFHAQAQLFQAKAKLLHQEASEMEKNWAEQKGDSRKENEIRQQLALHREQLSKIAPLAELCYELSFQRDPAQIESPYLEAVMQIQFGEQHLTHRQAAPALELFDEAIAKLTKVQEVSPHFVQSGYWLGLAFKAKAMASEVLGRSDLTRENLEKALDHFQAYASLDPFFPELSLERFYCHYHLGHQKEAEQELKKILFNTLHYGCDLFRPDQRLDTLRVSQILHSLLLENESRAIEVVVKRLHHFQSSTCLLPHLPKTQRHVKNSFHLLQDPYEQ